MTTIPHEIIRASAGTGKTFALSDRIVRLLALGEPPETIVALTFTRRAAAEFVSAVFQKLAEASLDPTAAGTLAKRLHLGTRTAADFAATLTGAVAAMGRLQFGTLDSFFQRIAGAIPFELGLSGPIQIMDQTAADEARTHALERLLRAGVEPAARRALLDAFRAATWGAGEKQLFPRLLRFVESGHDLFLEAQNPQAWGDEQAIWPDGNRWLPPHGDVAADIARVREFAETLDGRFGSAVQKFVEQAAAWQPGMEFPDGKVAEQLFALLAGADTEDPIEITYFNKPCAIGERWTPCFQRIVRRMLGATLEQALRAARGMHHLIADYDRLYESEIRRTGRLAFSDVIEMLRRVDPFVWQPRLDSRLAHWLFDEFQDTSVAQWAVLSELIDEALQDPSGQRSVFFVGDPKQAIYRWRGGEHRLMAGIAARYQRGILLSSLDESYRSAPAIIDFVNRVGGAALECGSVLPAAAIGEWRGGWSPHVSAVTNSEGFVRLREVAEKEDLHDALLASLQEADPIARGLTCAILTRGNDEAAEIAQALRERGFLDVAAETDVSIVADQPMTQALLALISAAAHPGDRASREIAEMSPLRAWLEAAGGWGRARGRVLDLLATRGCEALLREVLAGIPGGEPGGRFGALRLEQLLGIARGYDAGNSRGPDDFVRHARNAIRREVASAGRVQVMTIHKAKGLGFDFVLLPMRTNRRLDAVDSDLLLVARDGNQVPVWVIGRPPATVIEADPTLLQAQESRRADAAYESLCVLYVALTRARLGLHVFLAQPAKNDSTLSAAGLVRRAIAGAAAGGDCLWQHGDARWFEKPLREPRPRPPTRGRADWSGFRRASRMPALLPSRGGELRAGSAGAMAFGAAVHAAFAAIEWEDDAAKAKPAHVDAEAWRAAMDCLGEPAIAALFRKPEPEAKVWRERAFDVTLDGRWISGVFDRVVVAEGAATLVEFKTDRGAADDARARHAPQIGIYRAALGKLTGAESIRAVLVLTASRKVVEM